MGDKAQTMGWAAGPELRLALLADFGDLLVQRRLYLQLILSLHDMPLMCNVHPAWLTRIRAKLAAGPMNWKLQCLCSVVWTGQRLEN